MSETTIRPITAFDIAALAILHAEIFSDEPWDEAALTSVLSMPGAAGRLALSTRKETEPLGFVIGLLIGPECEILSIGVRSHRRHVGIGKALLDDFIDIAKIAGAKELFLEVAADNMAALTLYQAAGFETVGRRVDYYRRIANTRIDALQLRLRLSQ